MRHALALSLILAAAPALADSEARQGADFVRITAEPCKDAKVLAFIEAAGANPLDFRAARAEMQGAPYSACWKPVFDKQVIYLVYDDGDGGIVPFRDLKPVKAV